MQFLHLLPDNCVFLFVPYGENLNEKVVAQIKHKISLFKRSDKGKMYKIHTQNARQARKFLEEYGNNFFAKT